MTRLAMRYSADQKALTHQQIVVAAAREFRSKGLQGIGIADLMSQVGLTHGGFYAHFKDRDALVQEASVCAVSQSFDRLVAAAESAAPGQEIAAMLERYLSPGHRDDFADGCVLPALAAGIAQQSESVRGVFTEALQANLARIARYMPASSTKDKLAQAVTLISAMAGAVMLARATNDAKLSAQLLKTVHRQMSHLVDSWR